MGKIKIIVVSYRRPLHLRILIDCFRVQTDENWEMHIIHDGPAPDDVKEILPDDPRVIFYESEVRLGKYGHPNRRYMLDHVKMNTDDYVLITNDDNYYVPEYVNYMRRAIGVGVGVVYHDCLHNYYSYEVLKAKMEINYIDMGSFIVRADIAKKIRFTSNEFHADGIYAEAVADHCNKNNLKMIYLPRPLFIHN